MGSLFKHLQDLTENKTPTLGPVLSRDGALLPDEGSCFERWKDHLCSLLNNTGPSAPPNDSPSQPCSQRPGTDVLTDEPFSPLEIGHAVKRLKNNTAACICGLNSELLKYGGPAMLLFLHTLFSTIRKTEIIPEDWRKGVIIPLWKRKGSRSNCSNYRGITLLSVPGKVFSMVLLDRCWSIIRKIRRPEQAGFIGSFNHRADFHDSTNSREDHRVPTESIYCLRWLPCCIWLSRLKSSLADSRVDWPTREILQTSQGAAPWDRDLCTSKWSAQPVLSNHDRDAPRMCSGPRALQCHHRLRYDKNHFSALGSNS